MKTWIFNWRILDLQFPDELPKGDCYLYIAIVQGIDGGFSNKVYMEPKEFRTGGEPCWAEALIATAKRCHAEDAVVIWQPKPPVPRIPKRWKVCIPTCCDDRECDCYDNGYCLGDDDIEPVKSCQKGKIHREFSAGY